MHKNLGIRCNKKCASKTIFRTIFGTFDHTFNKFLRSDPQFTNSHTQFHKDELLLVGSEEARRR